MSRPAGARRARPALTPRQLEVLALVAEGLQDRETAKRLGISVITARQHAQDAVAAYKAQNRPHAVALAMRAGDLR